ncbi:hypothetical protein CWO85_02680 [Candidatus Phytoplasma ziziphi]|uniref:Peptidase M41 domain-containing protein n=1 Tax=Ziziphus jujuba witches'-broom phytoplasma TaxID=135727 RepID=A0A660HN16_ZIZJU|nr:hypothetical protein [Candidatus Phytoplasma ziziphi]AYJ01394.1 hypothetical protein CWO85_02680 [Candidatus Phytoplasma ziziphi]
MNNHFIIKNKNYLICLLWIFAINFCLSIFLYTENRVLINNFFSELFDINSEDSLEGEIYLSEDKITSYHESGHAIITLLYPEYFEFVGVTIKPYGAILGHCDFQIKKRNWQAESLVSFGGTSSESLLAKRKQIPKDKVGKGSGSDHANVSFLVQSHSTTPEKDYDRLHKECQKLIELNQTTLTKIAEKLFIKKTLLLKDIEDILKKYPLQKNI